MNDMTRGGLWASRRIRPDVEVSMISYEVSKAVYAYHVECDDILEGDLA
jgi:hypothetical protein